MPLQSQCQQYYAYNQLLWLAWNIHILLSWYSHKKRPQDVRGVSALASNLCCGISLSHLYYLEVKCIFYCCSLVCMQTRARNSRSFELAFKTVVFEWESRDFQWSARVLLESVELLVHIENPLYTTLVLLLKSLTALRLLVLPQSSLRLSRLKRVTATESYLQYGPAATMLLNSYA